MNTKNDDKGLVDLIVGSGIMIGVVALFAMLIKNPDATVKFVSALPAPTPEPEPEPDEWLISGRTGSYRTLFKPQVEDWWGGSKKVVFIDRRDSTLQSVYGEYEVNEIYGEYEVNEV